MGSSVDGLRRRFAGGPFDLLAQREPGLADQFVGPLDAVRDLLFYFFDFFRNLGLRFVRHVSFPTSLPAQSLIEINSSILREKKMRRQEAWSDCSERRCQVEVAVGGVTAGGRIRRIARKSLPARGKFSLLLYPDTYSSSA